MSESWFDKTLGSIMPFAVLAGGLWVAVKYWDKISPFRKLASVASAIQPTTPIGQVSAEMFAPLVGSPAAALNAKIVENAGPIAQVGSELLAPLLGPVSSAISAVLAQEGVTRYPIDGGINAPSQKTLQKSPLLKQQPDSTGLSYTAAGSTPTLNNKLAGTVTTSYGVTAPTASLPLSSIKLAGLTAYSQPLIYKR